MPQHGISIKKCTTTGTGETFFTVSIDVKEDSTLADVIASLKSAISKQENIPEQKFLLILCRFSLEDYLKGDREIGGDVINSVAKFVTLLESNVTDMATEMPAVIVTAAAATTGTLTTTATAMREFSVDIRCRCGSYTRDVFHHVRMLAAENSTVADMVASLESEIIKRGTIFSGIYGQDFFFILGYQVLEKAAGGNYKLGNNIIKDIAAFRDLINDVGRLVLMIKRPTVIATDTATKTTSAASGNTAVEPCQQQVATISTATTDSIVIVDKLSGVGLRDALQNNNTEAALQILQSSDFDVCATDSEGNNPLHLACFFGQFEVFVKIIELTMQNEKGLVVLTQANNKGEIPINIIRQRANLKFDDKRAWIACLLTHTAQAAVNDFFDPIYLGLLNVPVITPHGKTYSKESIVKCIHANGIDPFTSQSLSLAQLRRNLLVEQIIEEFKKLKFSGLEENKIKEKMCQCLFTAGFKRLLCCPLTGNMLEDPVVASDGKTYDRKALVKYLDEHSGKLPGEAQIIQEKCEDGSYALYDNLIVKNILGVLKEHEDAQMKVVDSDRHETTEDKLQINVLIPSAKAELFAAIKEKLQHFSDPVRQEKYLRFGLIVNHVHKHIALSNASNSAIRTVMVNGISVTVMLGKPDEFVDSTLQYGIYYGPLGKDENRSKIFVINNQTSVRNSVLAHQGIGFHTTDGSVQWKGLPLAADSAPSILLEVYQYLCAVEALLNKKSQDIFVEKYVTHNPSIALTSTTTTATTAVSTTTTTSAVVSSSTFGSSSTLFKGINCSLPERSSSSTLSDVDYRILRGMMAALANSENNKTTVADIKALQYIATESNQGKNLAQIIDQGKSILETLLSKGGQSKTAEFLWYLGISGKLDLHILENISKQSCCIQ